MNYTAKKIWIAGVLILMTTIGKAQSGQNLYDESYVHGIKITFSDPNFWDTLTTHYDNYLNLGAPKKYMMATVEIDGNSMDSIGVRQKGYFSNWGAGNSLKKPLKIDFREFSHQKYDGLKKINLANGFGDPTIMRDALAYHFFRRVMLPAPRTAYAKVYLNGTYWGLYCMVEQVDSEFLEDRYNDPDGNLYKCIDNTNLDWQGTNWSSYSDEFALKTNELINDNTRFIEWIDKINNTSSVNFRDSLDTIFETEHYLSILAGDVLMLNWDSYYEHGRNFYVYLNPDNNKFNWIPWDYNLAFSNSSTNIIINYSGPWTDPKPLVKNIQDDSYLKQRYFSHMCFLLLNHFNLTELEDYIDSTAARIRTDLNTDPNKFYTIQNFDDAITNDVWVNGPMGPEQIRGLKSFLTSRMTTVMNQLSQHGFNCVLGVQDAGTNELNWSMYPNPVHDGQLVIETDETEKSEIEVIVYNTLGEVVYQQSHAYQPRIKLDLNGYDNGLYLVKAVQSNRSVTKRIIKK